MRARLINTSGYLLFLLLAAFDIYPEYQGLSDTELARLERPADFDSEYQSQINAYTPGTDWEWRWHLLPRAFDTTVGSITNQHFMIQNRAKFETDLLETLRFRFIYFAQRDREIDQNRHVFELEQRLTSRLALAVYGEPGHYKRDNDLGYALLIEPAPKWHNRLYVTFHDFTRGNHNDQADRFVGSEPLSAGWTSLWMSESRVRAGFRYDRPVLWELPQQSRSFTYEKKLAFADVERDLSPEHSIGLRAQWDSTFKGQAPLAGSSVASESWRADRTLLRIYDRVGRADDPLAYETALMLAQRQWISQSDARAFHWNTMPSGLLVVRGARREQGFDHAHFGIEATHFRSFGDLSLTAREQKHDSLEARLHTAYEFNLRRQARLLLAFNFDLDEWVRVPTFEGGNARFRAEF